MAPASNIAAALLLAGVVVLLAWSLFCDRPRNGRRCPRCWYDMQGAPALTCPECGRRARSERDLRRTRRRWRWAAASLPLFLAAYVAFATPRIVRSGWIGLVPTTGLIWWVGRYEPPEVYANSKMSAPTRWA